MSLRIGLTGGIGSGKSTAASLLAARGAWIVDTDAIARSLTAPGGPAVPDIVRRLGPHFVAGDGGVDRAALRLAVFADAQLRLTLESILHPLIGARALMRAEEGHAGQPVVFDVPLLAESSPWRQRLDRVLVVDCSEETQMVRVQRRSGWTASEIERVMAQQCTRAQRRAAADAIIVNERDELAALAQELDALCAQGFLGQESSFTPM